MISRRGWAVVFGCLLVSLSVGCVETSTDLDSGRVSYLDGEWAVHLGDPVGAERPEYDDSTWERTTLSSSERSGWGRIEREPFGWYRRRIPVPEEGSAQVSLLLDCSFVAGEVYLDGFLAGSCGSIPGGPDGNALLVASPPNELGSRTHVTVAIRTWRPPVLSGWRAGGWRLATVPSFGDAQDVALLADRMRLQDVAQRAWPLLGLALLCLFAALFHGMIWMTEPSLRAHGWFALLVALAALAQLLDALRGLDTAVSVPVWWGLYASAGILFVGAAIFAQFVWRLVLRKQPGRFIRGCQALLLILGCLRLVAWEPWMLHVSSGPLVMALVLIPLVGAVGVTVRAAYRGTSEARILATGVAAAIALLIGQSVLYPGDELSLWVTIIIISATSLSVARGTGLSRRSIKRFVPFGFLSLLGRHEVREVEKGDHRQLSMSVLFLDVRGFTTRSEGATAEETFAFVNSLMERFAPLVQEHGGFIDKFIGDAVMALFPDRAGNAGSDEALAAAIALAHEARVIDREALDKGELGIGIGVGVHTGEVIIGTVGSGERMEVTVIGDTVNLASRIEGLTKRYGTNVLLTGACVEHLSRPDAVELRQVDLVRPKGKAEAVALHEVIDALEPAARAAASANHASFEESLGAWLSRDVVESGELLDACTARPDAAVALHRGRLSRFEANDENWDPVDSMNSK